MAKAKAKAGRVSMSDLRAMINKKAKRNVAHDLREDNPTEVKLWIPTGSRWLDSIICKGKYAGIPVGKVTELAGLEATGKSFLAAQIAANAQKMGIGVVYFDSESAIDPAFLEQLTTRCCLSGTLSRLPHQYQMLKETSTHNHLWPQRLAFLQRVCQN